MRLLFIPLVALCSALWVLSLPGQARAAENAPALSVVMFSPQEEEEHLTQIVVSFSEAMRPLGVMEQNSADSPLRLTSRQGELPAGSFRWLDPSTLAYLFDAPVSIPLEIEAFVPAGIKALSGAALADEQRVTVRTPQLAIWVTANGPWEDGKSLLPADNGIIQLESNYALDLESMAPSLWITDSDGKKRQAAIGPAIIPEWNLMQAQWTMAFAQPTEGPFFYQIPLKDTLPPNATLTLTLAPGLRVVQGPPSPAETVFSLRSYTTLTLRDISPQSATETEFVSPGTALFVHFNNPVSRAALLRAITVEPPAELAVQPVEDEATEDADTRFTLQYKWKPGTQYTVTITGNLKDEYGTTLAADASARLSVGDYAPAIAMQNGDMVLEARQGGTFPVTTRNAGEVTATLYFVPWNQEGFTAYGVANCAPGALDWLDAAPGVKKHSITIETADSLNEVVRHRVDIPQELGFDTPESMPGFAILTVSAKTPRTLRMSKVPDLPTVCARIQYSDLGLTFKRGTRDSLAWVTNLHDGKPVAGVSLELVDGKGDSLWRGVSDDHGLANAPGRKALPGTGGLFLTARQGQTLSVLPVEEKDGRWNAADIYNPGLPSLEESPKQLAAHALTQLPLYKPGQDVRYVLFLKEYAETLTWLPVREQAVSVEVRDSRNERVHTTSLSCNAYGSVSGVFTLPVNSVLGSYSFHIRLEDTADTRGGWLDAGSFRVAEFRQPEFKVDLTAPASAPVPSAKQQDSAAPLKAALHAGYFSGASLRHADAVLDVLPQKSFFKPERLEEYQCGLDNPFPFFLPRAERDPLGNDALKPVRLTARIDEEGACVFELPPAPARPGVPLEIGLTATVTDASGLTTQGNASYLVHPSALYIGMKGPRMALPDRPFTLTLKAAAFDNAEVKDSEVSIRAERRHFTAAGEELGEAVWENRAVLNAPEGDRVTVTLEKGGMYYIYASVTDSEGRENLSRLPVWIPDSTTTLFGPDQPGKLELYTDKDTYNPGDTARLILTSPFPRATALITTERDGIRTSRVVPVEGGAPVVDIPINDTDAPYIYASVTLVRGRIDNSQPAGETTAQADTGRPMVAHALLLLPVAAPKSVLQADITLDNTTYRPGGEVSATVTAHLENVDGGRHPKRAQVTLLAVDERVLRAAGERTNYDPSTAFSPVYLHSVKTVDLRKMLTGLLRFYNLEHMMLMDVRTGAGGSPDFMPMAASPAQFMLKQRIRDDGPELRSDFSPMAFWLAQGETDDTGTLEARFTLPDNVTGYRIVAVVADEEDRFVVAENRFTANLPLQLLPSLPGFLTEGDRLEARFLVQNLGQYQGTAEVTVTVEGAELDKDRATVELRPGSSGVAAFVLRAPSVGSVTLTATASLGDETDTARFTLPVLPSAPLSVVAASGMLKEGENAKVPVRLPDAADTRNSLTMVLAPSPAAGMPLAARQVLDYPWECLEQRFSKAWVRALRMKYGKMLALDKQADDAEVIAEIFKSAAEFQTSSGGFRLWPKGGEPDFYLTAYVLLVADFSQQMQLGLGPDVEQKAYAFLASQLDKSIGAERDKADWLKGGTSTRSMEAEALALWLLAKHKQHSAKALALFPAAVEKARSNRKQANPMLWSMLILSANELRNLPERQFEIDRLATILNNSVERTPTQLHFRSMNPAGYWLSMGSPLRDNAVTLAALALAKPDFPRLDALAFWLSQGLGQKQTLSTQEGVFGVWGLAVYLENLGGDGTAEATAQWNGKESMRARFTGLMQPPMTMELPSLQGGTNSLLEVKALRGNPCWTARLRYADPDGAAQARNAGFTVTRELQSASPWRMGDEIKVTLTLVVPAARRHVLLFDPFPAGLEPLYASRTDLAQQALGYTHPWRYQDLHKDGLLLYAESIEPGVYSYTYILRAAAPGDFTHRPAAVEEMYTPEVSGRTPVGKVSVLPE